MSFHASLGNIHAKTGKSPAQFKAAARRAGVYKPDMKASTLVAWLRQEYALGQRHCMAIWAVFKDRGWVDTPRKKPR